MKAILISIRSPHACNILNLIKLWEIRKKFSKYYVGWVYIYVTKALPHLSKTYVGDYEVYDDTQWDKEWLDLNGKVVARFWCDKVEEIDDCFTIEHIGNEYPDTYELGAMEEEQLLKECCLTKEEMNAYYKGVKEPLKAIHITKLEIFDEPKELSEFNVWGIDYPTGIIDPLHDCNVYYKKKLKPLTRAPQSWCYVEVTL